jgi:hypothetical protein
VSRGCPESRGAAKGNLRAGVNTVERCFFCGVPKSEGDPLLASQFSWATVGASRPTNYQTYKKAPAR